MLARGVAFERRSKPEHFMNAAIQLQPAKGVEVTQVVFPGSQLLKERAEHKRVPSRPVMQPPDDGGLKQAGQR
jgi:hypothetical protein